MRCVFDAFLGRQTPTELKLTLTKSKLPNIKFDYVSYNAAPRTRRRMVASFLTKTLYRRYSHKAQAGISVTSLAQIVQRL